MSDYKKTLQLPSTDFPMKANLSQKEPETLAFWDQIDVYRTMISGPAPKGPYVLHDGPPYANGHIHLGTALNKILKDLIVKSRNMMGYRAEYIPGWDCHGLPIEHKVELDLAGAALPALEIRKRCRAYAESFVGIQRDEFKRLGVLGEWESPYLTMHPAYEAATAGELAKFMDTGSVVRSKKAIYWCISCQTALAEAEVEYHDHTSPSIYVRFPLPDPAIARLFPQADPAKTFVAIWTTTPWTLPSNMAVAVHQDFDYVLVRHAGEYYLLAESLASDCATLFGWTSPEQLGSVKGRELEGLTARHPFYDRPAPLVLADYVTLDTGTGCVHTAPGHGREDYETGVRYSLPIYSPVDAQGRFEKEVEFFHGLTVNEANPKVIEKLKEVGNLLAHKKITHSYPHCWRCKNPVIFRATTQWFISMETNDLRKNALQAIDSEVRWIPAWGRERIYGMIENRPDWCLSRQRNWGVPIVALLCKGCDQAFFEPGWVRSIVDRFAGHERGCDYWYEASVEDVTPPGLTCPHCGGSEWEKELDILDVWFDSGTSFAAVLEQRPECAYPADLYLEGSDQHRGWFHSSLLASIGNRGQAPYRAVLTHGYVVDGEGRKMSKSVGNVIAPQEIIDRYGAEILRVWTASVDYREDIRISEEILSRLVDAYRRIRNTCRFLLGNLSDLDASDVLPVTKLLPVDRFALETVHAAHRTVLRAYEEFEFHKAFHTLHNLCVTDLSAFYLDILKDRLYASAASSRDRRSAQTALWRILLILVQDMAPILSFTAEEVYRHIPERLRPQSPTVFGLQADEDLPDAMGKEEFALWTWLSGVRDGIIKAMEPARQSGSIGHSLDAHVTLYLDDEAAQSLTQSGADLRELCIVSRVATASLAEAPSDAYAPEGFPGLKISVAKARGDKCARCWIYNEELETDPAHPGICPRCSEVLRAG